MPAAGISSTRQLWTRITFIVRGQCFSATGSEANRIEFACGISAAFVFAVFHRVILLVDRFDEEQGRPLEE